MDWLPTSQPRVCVTCTVVTLISSNISANSASLSADFLSVYVLYFSWGDAFNTKGVVLLDTNTAVETIKKPLYVFAHILHTSHTHPLLSRVAEGNKINRKADLKPSAAPAGAAHTYSPAAEPTEPFLLFSSPPSLFSATFCAF